MTKTILVVSAMLCCIASADTTPPAWQSTPQGQLILRPFDSAPYPHASRAQGYKTKTKTFPKDPNYTDSTVGIFIPAGYEPGDTVNYVVHFHGWNNNVAHEIKQYKLIDQFVDAKVNAILILPQGPRDAADSGGGKLEHDKGGFEKLIKDVTAFLNADGKIHTSKIGKIVLSTHSGGYKVTASILDHGGLAENISDVLLLDSSYGNLDWFAAWVKADPQHRLISLHTTHLDPENKELMGLFDKASVKYHELNEKTETEAELAARGATFVPVKGPHDEVPVQYFGRLLKTSILAKPATEAK